MKFSPNDDLVCLRSKMLSSLLGLIIFIKLMSLSTPTLATTASHNTHLDDWGLILNAESAMFSQTATGELVVMTKQTHPHINFNHPDHQAESWKQLVAQENAYSYENYLARQRKFILVGGVAAATATTLTVLIMCIHDGDQPGCPEDTLPWSLGIGLGVGITAGLITQLVTPKDYLSLYSEDLELDQIELPDNHLLISFNELVVPLANIHSADDSTNQLDETPSEP